MLLRVYVALLARSERASIVVVTQFTEILNRQDKYKDLRERKRDANRFSLSWQYFACHLADIVASMTIPRRTPLKVPGPEITGLRLVRPPGPSGPDGLGVAHPAQLFWGRSTQPPMRGGWAPVPFFSSQRLLVSAAGAIQVVRSSLCVGRGHDRDAADALIAVIVYSIN